MTGSLIILAWRNIWRNKRRSLISMSSVLFAVLLAVLFYSMEKGSYDHMIDNMVRYSTGYIQIQDVLFDEEPSMDNMLLYDDSVKDILNEMSDRLDWVPRIQGFTLAATDHITRGAIVNGIDTAAEMVINDLEEDLIEGSFIDGTGNGVLLAEGLAGRLSVTIGDTVTLLSQGFRGATAAGLYPVMGILKLRIPELNSSAIYMSLDEARAFYMADERLTHLIIMPHNPSHTDQIASELRERLDSEWYAVYTWEYLMADLLRLMKFDIGGTIIFLLILYMIIAFGLFGTILTMTIERMREFGMLMALGMKRKQIAFVSFTETLFLTFTGAVAGILVALPLVTYFHQNPIYLGDQMAAAMEDMGFEAVLPLSNAPEIFLFQGLTVFAIAVIVGLYPLSKIMRTEIVQTKQP